MKCLAILTGSHAYGAPTDHSDIDLVIRCENKIADLLRKNSDVSPDGSVRYGKLNLILCLEDDQYKAWEEGTKDLVAKHQAEERPIGRVEAKDFLNAVRKRLGIGNNYLEQPE